MKFLIVDDEAAARTDLEKVLHRMEKDAEIWQASNAKEALMTCIDVKPDVAFLDIRMPRQDGLTLARKMNKIAPMTNIIITTAYPEYALESYALYVSGYLLKPVMDDELREALNHLRIPVKQPERGLYVRCLGSFEVFYDGKPLRFSRRQAKELFAYLIDRRGATATNAECCAILWEDAADGSRKQRDYFHHIWAALKSALESVGCSDVLIYSRNAYAVDPDKIRCDCYEAEAKGNQVYGGKREYMSQYSWAESRKPF